MEHNNQQRSGSKKNNKKFNQNQKNGENLTSEVKPFKSKNMNYIYNVEYWEQVNAIKQESVDGVNSEICTFHFQPEEMFQALGEQNVYGKHLAFDLYTTYPGLLIGTGNLHDIQLAGAYKLGFSFDYVNGLPYLPGSSLKGLLRSIFPSQHPAENKDEYVGYLAGLIAEIKGVSYSEEELNQLEKALFDYQDVFLGAYPVKKDAADDMSYLATEYVTPHKEMENPNPISFVKVKPNVCFRFHFLLKDNDMLTAKEQAELFKKLILDLGIGAKTNVGFGKFSPKKNEEQICIVKAQTDNSRPMNRPGGNRDKNRYRKSEHANNNNRNHQHNRK